MPNDLIKLNKNIFKSNLKYQLFISYIIFPHLI